MKRFQLILSKLIPYGALFLMVFAVMVFGSQHKDEAVHVPISAVFGEASTTVKSDQVSEYYTVANIANTIALPSTATISENYVTVSAIYESTGMASTSGAVIEKPSIIDLSNMSRGVITHEVKEGETMESIIQSYNLAGVTTDQIRWSNGLKKTDLTVGQKIYIPSVPGIVYTTKKNDTYDGVAQKYESKTEEIIARNDLENTDIHEGMVILLPGGTLPEKERPEYVPPKPAYSSTRSYMAVTDSGVRKNLFMVGNYNYWRDEYYATKSWGNPGAFGNCTWFAWYWRRANMPSNYWLPTGALGNARSWNSTLAARGFPVGKEPAYGAVVQTSTSGYGHVGVVVGVDPGVSITIQEMNYAGPNGKLNIVYQSTIDWAHAVNYNYIYGR